MARAASRSAANGPSAGEAARLTKLFERRIRKLEADAPANVLWGGLKGVEQESLRVGPDGMLSRLPHPPALGSALTSRYITTDFSEALLEFVTPAFRHTWQVVDLLCDIHKFTYDRLDNELLW